MTGYKQAVEPHNTDPVLAVIPARFASTRLTAKPLYPLAGKPMIEWVWRRVAAMKCISSVVVATDDNRIVDVCREFGAAVEMTATHFASGTDRVAAVCELDAYDSFDLIVNIQGDEALIEENTVEAALDAVRSGWEVGTCGAPIVDRRCFNDPSVVKIARAQDGRALYFSRAPIPFQRDSTLAGTWPSNPAFLQHVGVYAFRRASLRKWVSCEPSMLEKLEQLEQLRALEAGMQIGVGIVEHVEGGVDTLQDAQRVEAILKSSQDS